VEDNDNTTQLPADTAPAAPAVPVPVPAPAPVPPAVHISQAYAIRAGFHSLLHRAGGTIEGVETWATTELAEAAAHFNQAIHWLEQHLMRKAIDND
jgi:hypothetical protein